MAVIYEVNLWVKREIETEYRAWFDAHVREMVALPGFLGAEVEDVSDPAPAADEFALCSRYRLDSMASLQAYLREHAPRLRADGLARFGDRFRAERRVLSTLTTY